VTPDRRLLAAVFALAVVAAGCGSVVESPVTGGPTAAPPNQAGQPTSAPGGQGNTPAPGAPSYGNNTTAAGAPELEKALPDMVGAETFSKGSFNGSTLGLAGAPFTANELDGFLKANGKTVADIAWAVGTGSAGSVVTVVRIKGVDAVKTMALLGAVSAELHDATLGTKAVRRGGAAGFWVALYATGDALFRVQSPDSKQLEAIVAALP
jgi:hypothetical protein